MERLASFAFFGVLIRFQVCSLLVAFHIAGLEKMVLPSSGFLRRSEMKAVFD